MYLALTLDPSNDAISILPCISDEYIQGEEVNSSLEEDQDESIALKLEPITNNVSPLPTISEECIQGEEVNSSLKKDQLESVDGQTQTEFANEYDLEEDVGDIFYGTDFTLQKDGRIHKRQGGERTHKLTPNIKRKKKEKKKRGRKSEKQHMLLKLPRNKSKMIKVRCRIAKRQEDQLAHLESRKENIQERVGALIRPIDYQRYSSDESYWEDYKEPRYEIEILPAQDLGVEEGPMYDRLLAILTGDGSIIPEDYDLLLQLDANNEKQVLGQHDIAKFPVLRIGEDEGQISRNDIGGSQCDICLETWADIPDGAEVRRLPCGHVFCLPCIDHWLKDVSSKCPSLSCYWCKEHE